MASLFDKLFKKPIDINSELERNFDFSGLEKENLPLNFEYGTSDFKKGLILNEYAKVKSNKDANKEIKDVLDISTVFWYDGFEGVEAGVFISNTSNTPVEIYRVNLGLVNNEGTLIRRKTVNLKGDMRIEPNSSFYYEILFENVHIDSDLGELKVVFLDIHELKVSYTKELDMENLLDKSLSEDTKEFLREKFYDIPSLRTGEFIVDPIFAMGEEDGIDIIILLRNGSHREINLVSLPVTISMQESLPIYIGTLNFKDKPIRIEPNKGKLVNMKIPKMFMPAVPVKDYTYKITLG